MSTASFCETGCKLYFTFGLFETHHTWGCQSRFQIEWKAGGRGGPWLTLRFSRVISSLRENLDKFKSRANQTGRMSASRDRKRKRMSEIEKYNLFHHHASGNESTSLKLLINIWRLSPQSHYWVAGQNQKWNARECSQTSGVGRVKKKKRWSTTVLWSPEQLDYNRLCCSLHSAEEL